MKGKRANLVGMRFGRLIVQARDGVVNGVVYWKCLCDCGTKSRTITSSLVTGVTKSCGCLRKEICSRTTFTHGMHKTREYRIYQSMKSRCYRKHEASHRYKDRGIIICDRWLNSFENFFVDMGHCPTGKHQIERKDNNGPYSPENCKWATALEQANNTSTNHNVSAFGKTQSLSMWARETGINRQTIHFRLRKGQTLEQLVAAPPRPNFHFLTAYGRTMLLSRWAEELGVHNTVIIYHLKLGRSMEKIVNRYVRN